MKSIYCAQGHVKKIAGNSMYFLTVFRNITNTILLLLVDYTPLGRVPCSEQFLCNYMSKMHANFVKCIDCSTVLN